VPDTRHLLIDDLGSVSTLTDIKIYSLCIVTPLQISAVYRPRIDYRLHLAVLHQLQFLVCTRCSLQLPIVRKNAAAAPLGGVFLGLGPSHKNTTCNQPATHICSCKPSIPHSIVQARDSSVAAAFAIAMSIGDCCSLQISAHSPLAKMWETSTYCPHNAECQMFWSEPLLPLQNPSRQMPELDLMSSPGYRLIEYTQGAFFFQVTSCRPNVFSLNHHPTLRARDFRGHHQCLAFVMEGSDEMRLAENVWGRQLSFQLPFRCNLHLRASHLPESSLLGVPPQGCLTVSVFWASYILPASTSVSQSFGALPSENGGLRVGWLTGCCRVQCEVFRHGRRGPSLPSFVSVQGACRSSTS